MSFIQREIDRLQEKILESLKTTGKAPADLYAASQALSWALEPTGFKSPYDMLSDETWNKDGPKPEGK